MRSLLLSPSLSLSLTHTQLGSLGIKSEGDLKYLDADGLKGLSLSQVSKTKICKLIATAGLTSGPADDLQVGARVCLHSMKDHSYNGFFGKLVHYSKEANRWNVDLGPPHFKTIAVSPTNLQICRGHEV